MNLNDYRCLFSSKRSHPVDDLGLSTYEVAHMMSNELPFHLGMMAVIFTSASTDEKAME